MIEVASNALTTEDGPFEEPVSDRSEKLPQFGRLPIHDDKLTSYVGLPVALIGRGVANISSFNMEASEGLAYVRMVIDAHHHLALATPHEFGHALVLLEWKVQAIACGLPVRGIHVEERVRPVVPLRAVEPGEVLDIGARQALPGC